MCESVEQQQRLPHGVLNSLVYNKVYPEPYYGVNNRLEEHRIPDLSQAGRDFYTYWFRTEFEVPAAFSGKTVWMQLDGIRDRNTGIWRDISLYATGKVALRHPFVKSEEWGSKVVSQLSEYIRSQRPDIKGYSKRNIYNMVMFYDEYSSETFIATIRQYLNTEFVQPKTAQFVQPAIGQMPKILELTSLTNHIEILCRCKSDEERLFYILYANKEHLVKRELQRCISNQTYAGLLGSKDNMSKGLLERYPNAPVMFKDTLFVDFLNLPKKHSETKLKNGLIEHMKQFILELGKDFIFMDQEYRLNIGTSTFKADLLFFHRGLQALVAVELKKTKFHPRDLGQLEFYLEALDRDVKRSNENPSIGIILCPGSRPGSSRICHEQKHEPYHDC